MEEISITIPVTEQDVVQSMRELAQVSVVTIGLDQTNQNLQFLANVIRNNPEKYKEIFKPENIKEVQKIFEKGVNMNNPMELIGIIGKLKKIFKL